MSQLEAKRMLRRHGQEGNWRFKSLMLAALPGTNVSKDDVARAWPSSGKSADYRFLSNHDTRQADVEKERRVVAEEGTEQARVLQDFAADSSAAPKHLSGSVVKELGEGKVGANLDDAIKRTLFASSTFEEINTLFREQLMETVMDGARRRQIARSAATVENVNTRQGDVPIGSDADAAGRVAQGAEIPDDGEDYTTVSWNAQKIAEGSTVTDEMRDHAMVDLIERQIQYLGEKVENGINTVWLTGTVDGALSGNDVTLNTGNDDPGYEALNAAYGEVDNEDFIPDAFATHPNYRTELFSDTGLRYANRSGSTETLRERTFEPLLDMEHFAASGGSYDDTGAQVGGSGGSNVWDFENQDDVGSVVFSKMHNHLFLYNPNGNGIEVKDYDDPIRDLTGVNARIHVDQDYSQARSASVIRAP